MNRIIISRVERDTEISLRREATAPCHELRYSRENRISGFYSGGRLASLLSSLVPLCDFYDYGEYPGYIARVNIGSADVVPSCRQSNYPVPLATAAALPEV